MELMPDDLSLENNHRSAYMSGKVVGDTKGCRELLSRDIQQLGISCLLKKKRVQEDSFQPSETFFPE